MTPDRWRAIEDVFSDAADLAPADRPAFLDAACRAPGGAPDPALREEVERLLGLDPGAEAFFGPLGEAPPPGAGPWRLVERIGEGGMGEVWRAERADGAYVQTAAVKLVRPGLAPDLLARFRAERHVLARLDHPAIARLLDGGAASDGRPYLALEYVDGEPITAYCDRRRLGVNERLALFESVCGAVAAAHRQLVVHRDLKPSNVLVAEDGAGTPRVKLLDFGIAKLLDDEAGITVVQTRADRRVMTPEYAAPEQVRGEPATTATDVYGLGVLLYELLTGQRPYRVEGRVRRAIEQAILEADPTDPSTAVTGATERAREVAAARATEPARLQRRLRGDLDRIVLKALRKEPDRRYDGAAALAADLGRHLGGLPVEARPESTAYRVGKFVRRHRVSVAAALVALAAILGGAGVAVWQARVAVAERDRAADRAAEAEAVTGFLVDMIGEARPAGADGDTLRVRDVLDAGAAQLDTGFVDRPLVRAALAVAFARSYATLGRSEDAAPLYRRALDLRRAALPRLDSAVIATENALAVALLNERRLDDLDALLTDAVAARRAGLGPSHPQVVIALADLGVAADRRADSVRRARAELYFREALDAVEGAGPRAFAEAYDGDASYDGFRASIYYSLAVHYMTMGRHQRAVEPMRLAVELSDDPPESDGHMILSNGYGVLLRQLERYDESIAVHRRVVETARRVYGPDHPFYGHPVLSLGSALQASGDAEGAVPVLREALRVFGGPNAENRTAFETRFYLGRALVEAGEVGEGRAVLRAALPGLADQFGPGDVRVRVARRLLAGG